MREVTIPAGDSGWTVLFKSSEDRDREWFQITISRAESEQVASELENEIYECVLRITRKYTKNGGRGASFNDIHRMLHRKNYSKEMILKVLEGMTELNEIKREETPPRTVGRPTVRYKSIKA